MDAVNRRHVPDLCIFLHVDEGFLKSFVAFLQPVHDHSRKPRIHEADFARRPGSQCIGMTSASHTDIGAAVALAQYDRHARYRHQRHSIHEVHDATRRAHSLSIRADSEARRIDELNDGNVERVAHNEEVDDLFAGLGVQRAAAMLRVVGDNAN